MLNKRTRLEGSIDDSFRSNSLSSSLAFVRGNHDAAAAVDDTVTERFGGESGEYDRVNGSDTRAGEESRDGLPGHGKVYRDSIALLHTERLQDIRYAADFVQEFAIADLAALTGLVSFINNSSLNDW